MPASEQPPNELPHYAKDWLKQWQNAAIELDEIRKSDLRALTDEEVVECTTIFDDLYNTTNRQTPAEIPEQNHLVIQQAWFQRFYLLQLIKEREEKSEQ